MLISEGQFTVNGYRVNTHRCDYSITILKVKVTHVESGDYLSATCHSDLRDLRDCVAQLASTIGAGKKNITGILSRLG